MSTRSVAFVSQWVSIFSLPGEKRVRDSTHLKGCPDRFNSLWGWVKIRIVMQSFHSLSHQSCGTLRRCSIDKRRDWSCQSNIDTEDRWLLSGNRFNLTLHISYWPSLDDVTEFIFLFSFVISFVFFSSTRIHKPTPFGDDHAPINVESERSPCWSSASRGGQFDETTFIESV